MAQLRGTHGHVVGRAFLLEGITCNLRSILNVTRQLVYRWDEEDDHIIALIAMCKISREECEKLDDISKGLREIADDLLRQETATQSKA